MFFPKRLVLNEKRCLCDRNWIIERNLSGVTSPYDVVSCSRVSRQSVNGNFTWKIGRKARLTRRECLEEDFINVKNIHGWRQWLTDERNVKTHSPTRFQQHLRSETVFGAIITFHVNEQRKVSPKARGDDFCKLCRIFDCFCCWVRVCFANWILGLFVSLFLVSFFSLYK